MYANILLSTDGSDVARKGVEHGIALAKALNARLTIITVTEALPVDYGSGHASGWIPTQDEIDSFDAACKARAGKVLDDARAMAEQIGTPAEIYHGPKNLFIAGFVGQPQMNFIQGRVAEGRLLVAKSGMNFDLSWIRTEHRLGGSPIDITIGIRPEDLRPCSRTEAWFSGIADFVEDLGSDCFVHVIADGEKLIARAPGRTPIRRGDEVFLCGDPERAHVFEGDKRVE